MLEEEQFKQLIERVRSGDQAAAEELVRDYESLIRREVRMRLEDNRMRRVLDSMDVCQSVLASFFVRTALGEFDLAEPKQLIGLLVIMTRNKVASIARREHSLKRDRRRTSDDDEALTYAASDRSTPSQIVANQELVDMAKELLSPETREIAEMRNQGATWEMIATTLGGTAHARRVQYSRAIEKVRCSLGIDVDE